MGSPIVNSVAGDDGGSRPGDGGFAWGDGGRGGGGVGGRGRKGGRFGGLAQIIHLNKKNC